MHKTHKDFFDVAIRYSILILSAISGLWIFYFFLTPLTFYPTYLILNLFFDVMLIKGSNIIIVNNEIPIEIVKACVAGSAYYLLLVLNLSTPKIKIETRIKMILSSFAVLLTFNILRIVLLSFIFLEGLPLFVAAHQFFWYFLSTVFVVAIWFSEVKIFKIKEIPFYSDFKLLHKHSFFSK